MIKESDVDSGLSKKSLQEVQVIVDFLEKRMDEKNIVESRGLVNEIKLCLCELEKKLEKQIGISVFELEKKVILSVGELEKKVILSVGKLEEKVIGIEFKHNWKTAFWVFIGSATPASLAVIFFIFKVGR